MSANNKCFFLGRFTADPELRYAGETAIARGRIAVSRRYKRFRDMGEYLDADSRPRRVVEVEPAEEESIPETPDEAQQVETSEVPEDSEALEEAKTAENVVEESPEQEGKQ